jgi:hypothetical protein
MKVYLWTWSGEFFGYREADELWTHDGRHVGRFSEDDVYGTDGSYLGEMRGRRLIRKTAKEHKRRGGFTPKSSRVSSVPYANYVGNVMILGYEDFPSPERL